jgi:hypothetical protein
MPVILATQEDLLLRRSGESWFKASSGQVVLETLSRKMIGGVAQGVDPELKLPVPQINK